MKIREGNIQGFSRYYITKSGKLYSNWRGKWNFIKPVMKDNGYISNNLVGDDGKRYNLYRHRLVAMVWIPNPNPNRLSQVCHKDNNPLNNRVENLYWGTPKDNMGQCIRDGRFYFVGKERERSIDSLRLIRFYKQGKSRKEILDEFGISLGVYYKILKINNVKLRR